MSQAALPGPGSHPGPVRKTRRNLARILVIDDEDMVRLLLRQMLEVARHEVEEAATADEGIACYDRRPADVVITDIQMPRKNGIQVIRTLRSGDPEARIIAITGYDPDALAEAKRFGARCTMTKPFHMRELLDTVHNLLADPA